MLLNFPIHYTFLPCYFFNRWKEVYFFKVVVRFNELMPSETIPYEIWIISLCKLWGLLVDAVVASNQRVVTECHV